MPTANQCLVLMEVLSHNLQNAPFVGATLKVVSIPSMSLIKLRLNALKIECTEYVKGLFIEARVMIYNPSSSERYQRTSDEIYCGRWGQVALPPGEGEYYTYEREPDEYVVYIQYYFEIAWNNGSVTTRTYNSRYYD